MDSPLIAHFPLQDKAFYARGREVFIRLSLLALMCASCVLLLRPFVNVILCGIIVGVAIFPAHRMLTRALGGRAKLAAVLCSLLLMLLIILPSIVLAGTLVDGIKAITQQLQAGHLNLPPAPASLVRVPVIGPPLQEFWTLCSTNLSEVVKRFGPQIQQSIPALLSASAGVAAVILQFFVAVVLAGFFLATSEACGRFTDRLFLRIFGAQGLEFKDLVGSTIRTVTNGILGVAVIQTLFASLGFWFAGLPGAGLWAMVFLIAAVLQVGALVLVPAVLYAFATFSTTGALVFLLWCVIVGIMDNILKPILLGRGAKVPMLVILLGVLGGFMAMNSIIGLFVGAIVLSVGYKLFLAWLDGDVPHDISLPEPAATLVTSPE